MKKAFVALLLLALTSMSVMAQIPNGYYDDATGKTGTELRQALHDIIDNHTTISYNNIWSAFWSTDNKGNGVVWDMYSDIPGGTPPYTYYIGQKQCGSYNGEGDCYNREHSWPKSWFSGGEDGVPGRDLHHIFPTDGYVNQGRSNYPYGEVRSGSGVTTYQNGSKLGPCKSSLDYTGTVFEPIDEYKGDFARAYFYMCTRYYGEDSDWGSSGMTTKANLKDWAVTMLLRWSDADPVSQKEIDRNNAVYGIQGNRNPFIDHPEYAHIIWEPGWSGVTYNIACASDQHGTITAPATAVEGTMVTLSATPSQGYMLDSWNVYNTDDANTTVPVSANGTFTMPSFNVTVSATFTQNTTAYNITCATGLAHGSISTSVGSAQSGTPINLSHTPASGYVLYSYYVYKTGDVNTIVYSGSGNTFTMPAYDVTVSASFVQPSSYSYVKVTEAPTDWSGEYLIVYEDGSKAFNGGLTTLDATNNTISITINNDNTIASTTTTDAARFTVAKSGNNYTIKSASGRYIGRTSDSNGLEANQTTAYTNTISYNTTENIINVIGSGGAYLRYNKANDQQRFRYFKSSTYTDQQPIQFYKKTANAFAPTHTIQFNPNGGSQSSYNQTVNEFEPTALQANTFTRQDYAFDSWNTAADGTGTTYFDGAVVTLLNDLTLYAQWKPLYTITLAAVENGNVTVSHNEAVEGDVITLTATPNSGYEFDHWVVTDASNNTVAVTDNQFEMPAANVTVNAAFVYVGAPFAQQYHLVTSTDQLVAGRTYLIVNTDYGKALGKTQNTNNRSAAAVTIDNNVISTLGDACELTLGGETGAWTFYDATNNSGYLYAAGGSGNNNYLKTQTTLTDAGKWIITLSNNKATIKTIDANVNRHTIMYNNSSNIFSCYASGQKAVYLFIRSEEYEYTESATVACLNSFDKHTIHSGVKLTANNVLGMSQCNNAEQIILEDGAQLIHTATGLNATLKKAVTAYSGDGGWYTISVPFGSFDPQNTTMVGNDFDLYAYDEDGNSDGKEWINYKAGSFNLASGEGYLYAHNPGTTLRMAGTLNSGNYTQTVNLGYANSNAAIKGFNLLGNPTAHEITFSKTASVSDGYYYLNNNENWVYSTSNVVPVGRGFLVKANATNQSVTLNPQTRRGESLEEGQYLSVSVGESKAYVKLNDGVSMPLMSLRGQHSNLYLISERKPYAMLVRSEADAVDLCFEPHNNGIQTLTVDTEGLNLDYLHLVDHKTGADIDLLIPYCSAGQQEGTPGKTGSPGIRDQVCEPEPVSAWMKRSTCSYCSRVRIF